MNIVLTEFSYLDSAGKHKELLQQCFDTNKQTVTQREFGTFMEKLDFPYKVIDQAEHIGVNMVG